METVLTITSATTYREDEVFVVGDDDMYYLPVSCEARIRIE